MSHCKNTRLILCRGFNTVFRGTGRSKWYRRNRKRCQCNKARRSKTERDKGENVAIKLTRARTSTRLLTALLRSGQSCRFHMRTFSLPVPNYKRSECLKIDKRPFFPPRTHNSSSRNHLPVDGLKKQHHTCTIEETQCNLGCQSPNLHS